MTNQQHLLWRSIPSEARGDELTDKMRRLATAKRGLEAAFDNEDLTPSPEEKVVDMMADMRHLCQWLGIDYHECNDTAYQHYLEEKKEYEET